MEGEQHLECLAGSLTGFVLSCLLLLCWHVAHVAVVEGYTNNWTSSDSHVSHICASKAVQHSRPVMHVC
jgi:hypothetical protein